MLKEKSELKKQKRQYGKTACGYHRWLLISNIMVSFKSTGPGRMVTRSLKSLRSRKGPGFSAAAVEEMVFFRLIYAEIPDFGLDGRC